MATKTLDLAGISVHVGKNVHPVYEELVSRASGKAEDFPFRTMKDLFVVAACAGAKYGQFVELSSSRDIFTGDVFDTKTDVPILQALAYIHSKDVWMVTDPKKVVDIAEGWANGGIRFVRAQLIERPGRPLYNLIDWVLSELGTT